MLEAETGCEIMDEEKIKSLANAGIPVDTISKCAINKDGQKVKAHIFQNNLYD